MHAAYKGAALYMPYKLHACGGGRGALGMEDSGNPSVVGEMLVKMGLSTSVKPATDMWNSIPRIQPGTTNGTLVGPLHCFNELPDVVIVICRVTRFCVVWYLYLAATGGNVDYKCASNF